MARAMTTDLFIDIIGWIGALLILAAYALLTAGRLTGQSALYQWMNVFGAIGFVANGLWNGAYPSAGLNIVWIFIGLFALWRMRVAKA
jgi:hypothetical protein